LICLLDACALIALLAKETGEGYEVVKDLFEHAETEGISLSMSILNLFEAYYHFIRVDGIDLANEIMEPVKSLPIKIIRTITDAVYSEAARFKVSYTMSFADAFLCGTAKSLGATIVTKDGEIRKPEQPEALSVLWIKSYPS